MIFTDKTRLLTIAFALVFLLVAAQSVNAQQQGGYEQEMMMPQPGSVEVSDAELEKVANAYIQITEIREAFQESLAEVSDPEQAQQLQEQAGQAMVDAVQDNGLDVQKYNEVMEAAQVDEELREQLLTHMQKLQ